MRSYLAPYRRELPHTCHSLGKSYTCTGVGLACAEGLLSPDTLVTELFEEEIRRFSIVPGEGMKKLRLRHLMSMSCGMKVMPELNEGWIENFLREEVVQEPGTQFLYNSTGSCLLGAAVEKVTGMPLESYMRSRLFDKIGIGPEDLVWRRFENGLCAEPGISATTRANLRLGLFYLARGCVNGEQLVAREWMDQAMKCQIATGDGQCTDDQNSGYGWQLWMCRPEGMMRFDGGQGQFCVMDTRRDLAVAIHQGGWHPTGAYQVLGWAEEMMLSATDEALEEDPEAYGELQRYLASRCLAQGKTAQAPCEAKAMSGFYHVTRGRLNPWIEVAPVDEDFYHLFYDPSFKAEVTGLEIRVEDDAVTLVCNGRSSIRARLDGQWVEEETATPLPELGHYAATAWFEDDKTLHVAIKWLSAWCSPQMTFRLADDATLEITVAKDMLHEGRKPVTRSATARRVR